MSRNDVVRAWKNPLYRSRLNQTELGALPENPAGAIARPAVQAPGATQQLTTAWFCTLYTIGGSRCCN